MKIKKNKRSTSVNVLSTECLETKNKLFKQEPPTPSKDTWKNKELINPMVFGYSRFFPSRYETGINIGIILLKNLLTAVGLLLFVHAGSSFTKNDC